MTSELAQIFLKESGQRERRIRWIKQTITAFLVIAAVATFLSSIYAFSKKQEADGQRQKAVDASDVAVSEKVHAEKTLLKLIKTTNDMVSNTDWMLSRNPGNFRIREESLNSLDQSLDSLSEQDHQEFKIIEITIKMKHRRGDLALNDGTLKQAEELYILARTELDRISVDEHRHDPWRELLALNHSKLGKVAMARNQLGKAQAHLDQSLDLLKNAPSDEGANRTLATTYKEMANLEVAKNRLEEASRLHDEAVNLFSKLDQTNEYHRSLLAEALCASAATANRRKNPALAGQLLSRAQSIVPRLSVDTYSQLVQAHIFFELGVLDEAQKPREALRNYQKSFYLGERLHQGDPTRKSFTLVWLKSLQQVITTASASQEQEVATSARRQRDSALERLDVDGDDVRFQGLGAL